MRKKPSGAALMNLLRVDIRFSPSFYGLVGAVSVALNGRRHWVVGCVRLRRGAAQYVCMVGFRGGFTIRCVCMDVCMVRLRGVAARRGRRFGDHVRVAMASGVEGVGCRERRVAHSAVCLREARHRPSGILGCRQRAGVSVVLGWRRTGFRGVRLRQAPTCTFLRSTQPTV